MQWTVAQDGTGNYASIQAAVDAVPEGKRETVTILIQPGTYRERVILNKDNVTLVGADAQGVELVFGNYALQLLPDGTEKTTFLTATLLITGDDVTVENMTIRNDAGDGRVVGQAVAVYAAGDRGIFRKCRMIAAQDTLYCGPTMPNVARDALPRIIPQGVAAVAECQAVPGRQYFEACYIQGDVDFIFGPYRCWFERCTLFCNERGGFYTAANTPEKETYGLVFHRCKLTGACAEGAVYLGRPWREFAATVFLHCDMDAHMNPEGFCDWESPYRPVTGRYAEYGTTGARSDTSTRHPKEKLLTHAEAEEITLQAVLGGTDGWMPG